MRNRSLELILYESGFFDDIQLGPLAVKRICLVLKGGTMVLMRSVLEPLGKPWRVNSAEQQASRHVLRFEDRDQGLADR